MALTRIFMKLFTTSFHWFEEYVLASRPRCSVDVRLKFSYANSTVLQVLEVLFGPRWLKCELEGAADIK